VGHENCTQAALACLLKAAESAQADVDAAVGIRVAAPFTCCDCGCDFEHADCPSILNIPPEACPGGPQLCLELGLAPMYGFQCPTCGSHHEPQVGGWRGRRKEGPQRARVARHLAPPQGRLGLQTPAVGCNDAACMHARMETQHVEPWPAAQHNAWPKMWGVARPRLPLSTAIVCAYLNLPNSDLLLPSSSIRPLPCSHTPLQCFYAPVQALGQALIGSIPLDRVDRTHVPTSGELAPLLAQDFIPAVFDASDALGRGNDNADRSSNNKSNSRPIYNLRSMVAYGGAHFVAYTWDAAAACWWRLNDTRAAALKSLTDVKAEMLAGLMRPVLALWDTDAPEGARRRPQCSVGSAADCKAFVSLVSADKGSAEGPAALNINIEDQVIARVLASSLAEFEAGRPMQAAEEKDEEEGTGRGAEAACEKLPATPPAAEAFGAKLRHMFARNSSGNSNGGAGRIKAAVAGVGKWVARTTEALRSSAGRRNSSREAADATGAASRQGSGGSAVEGLLCASDTEISGGKAAAEEMAGASGEQSQHAAPEEEQEGTQQASLPAANKERRSTWRGQLRQRMAKGAAKMQAKARRMASAGVGVARVGDAPGKVECGCWPFVL
jgi:hypothetical protein